MVPNDDDTISLLRHEVVDPVIQVVSNNEEQEENVESNLADDVITDISLAEDKLYHVVFSHSSDPMDRQWVIECMRRLEAEPYNLKCCFADRDFLPSRTVIDNIGEAMSQSMAVIFILSPEHLESPYCEDEVGLAFQMKRENKMLIIPILLRGSVEQIPQTLKFINYIDANEETEEEITKKILRALLSGGLGLQERRFGSNDRGINGDMLNIPAINVKGRPLNVGTKFPQATEHDVRTCEDFGIKMPLVVLNQVLNVMTDCTFMRSSRVLEGKPGVFCFVSLMTITFVMSYVSMASLVMLIVPVNPDVRFGTYFYGFLVIFVTFLIASLIYNRFKAFRLLRESIVHAGRMSQHLYLNHKALVAIVIEDHIPNLQIIKYDTTDCEKYIFKLLRELSDDTGGGNEMHQVAQRVVRDTIPLYLRVLVHSKQSNIIPRHRMKKDVMCLCQFVQTHGLHTMTTDDITRAIPLVLANDTDNNLRVLLNDICQFM